MLYRVFNNETELAEANGLWIGKRWEAGERDRKLGIAVDPQITEAWSEGKVMLDGRIACQVPGRWADEFGGLELELTSEDFPVEEGEV